MDIIAKIAERIASNDGLRSRRAMYWHSPNRTYRLTRSEQQNSLATCPKCTGEMQKEPFTKSEKIFVCPSCKFKVPTGSVVTEKVTVDIDANGGVEVTVGSRRSRTDQRS